MEGSSEVSRSGLAITPGTDQPLLSLAFKWIATLIIVLMACWIVYISKTTISLHNPHNIFVMITDTITAMLTTILPSMIIVRYATIIGSHPNCQSVVYYNHYNNASCSDSNKCSLLHCTHMCTIYMCQLHNMHYQINTFCYQKR